MNSTKTDFKIEIVNEKEKYTIDIRLYNPLTPSLVLTLKNKQGQNVREYIKGDISDITEESLTDTISTLINKLKKIQNNIILYEKHLPSINAMANKILNVTN